MKTNIPRVILDGTLFDLDHAGRQFIQTGYAENRISYDSLERHGDYYLLNYNSEKKQVMSPTGIRSHQDELKVISIHQAILTEPANALDTGGFCKVHNQQSYARDLGILLVDEAIDGRLGGKLPIIDIDGYPFYVDLRMRALRPHDDVMNLLEFKDMYLYKKDEFQCFYEPFTHQLVKLDISITEFPKGIVGIYVPSEKQLDPISYARLAGLGETSLLPKYPQQTGLKAEVRPLYKTWLGAQVRQNRKDEAQEAIAIIQTPAKRKKGKSL
ncbi:MAG: hypothetical protein V4594_19960 [Bacteroidota bacterium]